MSKGGMGGGDDVQFGRRDEDYIQDGGSEVSSIGKSEIMTPTTEASFEEL